MKILTISAHYPPCHFGGYELRVKDIMDGLAARGHQILALTNHPEKNSHSSAPGSNYSVNRKLHSRHHARFFPKEVLFDLLDTRLLEKKIKEFQPDVIYLGHTNILSKALLPYLSRQDIPIVYDEGGSGLIEAWTEHGRWFRFTGDYQSRYAPLNLLKPMVIKLVCRLSRGRITPDWSWPVNVRVIFNSQLNLNNAVTKGVPVSDAVVIHSGIDLDKFTFRPRTGFSRPLRIIVPGRIEKRKGQMDAVQFLKQLIDLGIDSHLILAGRTGDKDYFTDVVSAIENYGLTDRVEIKPMLSTEELVGEYHKTDICFFPSYYRTGFSRVPLEAMACGCIVISYGNEGSDEIIKTGINGFIVQTGNYQDIIKILFHLWKSKKLKEKIISNIKLEIEKKSSMLEYLNQIHFFLKSQEL